MNRPKLSARLKNEWGVAAVFAEVAPQDSRRGGGRGWPPLLLADANGSGVYGERRTRSTRGSNDQRGGAIRRTAGASQRSVGSRYLWRRGSSCETVSLNQTLGLLREKTLAMTSARKCDVWAVYGRPSEAISQQDPGINPLAVKPRQEDGRIGDEQRAVASEDLSVGDAKQAPHVHVFGFVQLQQLIAVIHLEQ